MFTFTLNIFNVAIARISQTATKTPSKIDPKFTSLKTRSDVRKLLLNSAFFLIRGAAYSARSEKVNPNTCFVI